MKRKVFLILLIAVFTATLFITARLYVGEEEVLESYQGDVVIFSLGELNYDTPQVLTLAIAEESGLAGEIRYTTDGSEPALDSDIYTAPLELAIMEGRKCHIIRAALFQGEERSRVYTRSYFIGGEAALDDGEYVVSITANPDDFYGLMGIFYGPENLSEQDFRNKDLIINFRQKGRAWEKRANIEIYNSDGDIMMSQLSGIRIAGNWSRYYDVKSLRFYARSEYDISHPKFDCSFLDLGKQPNGLNVSSINQLDLRNGGNRWVDTMLSDVYARKLAADAGFEPVGQASPAAVYINGEWYGFMWLEPSYCEKNIEEMLSLPNSEDVRIVSGAERVVDGEEEDVQDYADMYKAVMGISDEENAAMVEEILDIDNTLLHYALEMYLRNTDWIGNNMKMWRYAGKLTPDNKYTDGRWRFIIYDFDNSLGVGKYVDPELDVFEWIFGEREASGMLIALMRSAGFRTRFMNIWCDLLATTLDAEYALAVLEETIALTASELEYREQERPDKFSKSERLAIYDSYRDFIKNRESYIRESLVKYLGAQDTYTLEVVNTDAYAEIVMNSGFVTLMQGEALSGHYYADNPCVISAAYQDGYEFDYWLVNGAKIETETLVLDGGIVNGEQNVSVSLVTQRTENADPILTKISYKGADDWVEIKNPGSEPLSLLGYYLSDRTDNPYKYSLPDITLGAGESVIIYSNNNIYAPLGSYQFGFKLAQYETLILTGAGETLEEVYLPNSKEGYIYGRMEHSRGWQHVLRQQ